MRISKRIQTERLLLREYTAEDTKKFITLGISFHSTGKIDTVAKAKKYFAHVKKDENQFALAIILKENKELIGNIEMCHMHWFNFQAGEIAYHIHENQWGKGYATEAAKGLIDYCFKTLKMHKLYADTEPSNIASQKVLEKLGFKLEGRIRERRQIKGKWVDELDYGLLRKEWGK